MNIHGINEKWEFSNYTKMIPNAFSCAFIDV